MAGADSGPGPGAGPGWRWDVALSFAAAQRDYVEQVARALQARGVRCFYDADEQIELWGKYLAEELPTIYGERAAAVVVIVSAEYADRDWTRLERRAALNRAVQERREYVLPARFDDTPLPGLLSDLVAVDLRGRTPEQFAALVAAKLAALDITAAGSAGNPSSDAGIARPPGAVRAGEADLRRLGVHAAISVPGLPDEVPPEYVPRDVDAAGHGVRAKVAAAAERGGFVLLVGGSSVGKTRCAAEAVKALLPDWWLVHPASPAEVAALAAAPPGRTVVWLDELPRYLDGEHGLDGGMVRALLNVPGPVLILGTLWPDRYAAYTAVPEPGDADPHAREREVLDLAAVIGIGAEFSPAEQDRARTAAGRDGRLALALGAEGYGLTQTLAAAPQLVARWEGARDGSPYAWAVLTAALDAARLGARGPLTADLLRAAAPGYCTSAQQAAAPGNWFEQALAYATARLHGAAAALSPVGSGMGQIDGYTVAEYLLQHAIRERRTVRVPASTWDALLLHIRDPADAGRVADSAKGRLLYRYAIPLYRYSVDADVGGWDAVDGLAFLLAERGDLDGAVQVLRARADTGDGYAADQLAFLLAERGDLDGLRARADTGDGYAADQLAFLLAERGDLDGLRARADAGDGYAAERLAFLLAERGDLDEAVQVLRARADAGDGDAAERLAERLAERGDLDEAVQILRARADAGDGSVAERLAFLLAERGDLDGAVKVLRARADAGDGDAARRLIRLLAERGDLDGLRARADAGDGYAAERLAFLLAERGDLDEAVQILRAQADAGDGYAAERLAFMLGERGDLDGLRARADAGDRYAAARLAFMLAERGDLDGLRARADAGDRYAAERLAFLLAERGDLDEAVQILRAQVDAGDGSVAERLAFLLAERGDLDGLRARADAGDGYATERLAFLLAERGDLDGLRARADAGDRYAADQLADRLAGRGDLGEAVQILRAQADAGDGDVGWLAKLLTQQGRDKEAERLRRFGLNPDGSVACG